MNKIMKTNEAPEKIYLTSNENGIHYYTESQPFDRKYIKYTRTNALIEKVSDWLKDCATFTDMNGKKHIDKEMYKTTFDDFVNYVKEK